MSKTIRTIEAVYEAGYLRPKEPIEAHEGMIFIITIVDTTAVEKKSKAHSLRGKYRGKLSTTDEFIGNKPKEKRLEL